MPSESPTASDGASRVHTKKAHPASATLIGAVLLHTLSIATKSAGCIMKAREKHARDQGIKCAPIKPPSKSELDACRRAR